MSRGIVEFQMDGWAKICNFATRVKVHRSISKRVFKVKVGRHMAQWHMLPLSDSPQTAPDIINY